MHRSSRTATTCASVARSTRVNFAGARGSARTLVPCIRSSLLCCICCIITLLPLAGTLLGNTVRLDWVSPSSMMVNSRRSFVLSAASALHSDSACFTNRFCNHVQPILQYIRVFSQCFTMPWMSSSRRCLRNNSRITFSVTVEVDALRASSDADLRFPLLLLPLGLWTSVDILSTVAAVFCTMRGRRAAPAVRAPALTRFRVPKHWIHLLCLRHSAALLHESIRENAQDGLDLDLSSRIASVVSKINVLHKNPTSYRSKTQSK